MIFNKKTKDDVFGKQASFRFAEFLYNIYKIALEKEIRKINNKKARNTNFNIIYLFI